MGIKIKRANNNAEYEICLDIQREVFIKEQGIPEKIVIDENSSNSAYVYAIFEEKNVGAARYRTTDFGIKLERFAVLKEFRKKGIGKSLVQFLCKKLDKDEIIYLHAQESVIGFYSLYGFKKFGKKFFEAGIGHWKMIKT